MLPILPDGAAPCDCKALKTAAFQIHVACYTQPGASVCDLGLSDWVTIYHIIDNRDLFSDPDSKAQILAVAHICVNNRPDGPIKFILNILAKESPAELESKLPLIDRKPEHQSTPLP